MRMEGRNGLKKKKYVEPSVQRSQSAQYRFSQKWSLLCGREVCDVWSVLPVSGLTTVESAATASEWEERIEAVGWLRSQTDSLCKVRPCVCVCEPLLCYCCREKKKFGGPGVKKQACM